MDARGAVLTDKINKLKRQIERAREYGRDFFETRAEPVRLLSGTLAVVGSDIEFPDVDLMHVYQTMFGTRFTKPIIFRLSFGRQLKWVCVKHPWGLKAADIIVPEEKI